MQKLNPSTKNLIISPCGNRSRLFRDEWIKDLDRRDFDICLLFYDEVINDNSLYKDIDYFFHLKGFKYAMIHDLLTNLQPEILQKYEHFYFPDDDISIDTQSINKLFHLHQSFEALISQASLTEDSFCSWKIFKTNNSAFCRYCGQIEVMAPMFSKAALLTCLPSFIGNKSSWGIDSVWSKLLSYPTNKLIIFDCIQMKHTQPVGGGELYKKINVDPHEDWKNVTEKFNAKHHNYTEYGRLSIVNQKSNRLDFYRIQLFEGYNNLLRKVKDYDIGSRINNKLGIK